MNRLIISEPSILLKSKLNEYTSEVIEEKDDFNYCVFDFEETPLDEIIDALQSPAFGSEKKVVICKNPYFIKDSKLKLPFENDLSKLEEYIKDSNPDTEFIIVCGKKYHTGKSKFINLIAKHGEVINLLFENEDEFISYGSALLTQTNIKITPKAKTILFERCASDVCKLEREIAKLALYNDEINEEIIKKMVAKPLEDNVFELSNALLQKDRQRIMRIYTDLKLLKMEPVYLISLLASQFRLILESSILMKNGKNDNEIATYLNVHPYRVKMAIRHLQNYNLNDVKNILIDLATLDAKIKSGESDRFVDFELFLSTK